MIEMSCPVQCPLIRNEECGIGLQNFVSQQKVISIRQLFERNSHQLLAFFVIESDRYSTTINKTTKA